MARGGGRSPSRAVNRRDDYRDGPRNKRGRSRSPDRRDRDYYREPYRRRSRSPGDRRDRRDDDYRRPDRRDRSRERPPNGFDRDRRRRSRERGDRPDGPRDQYARRPDDSADSYRSRREGPSDPKPSSQSSKPAQLTEEQIKAERQAKIAAWKQKKEQEAKGDTVSNLKNTESKASASMSPRSPSQATALSSNVGSPSTKTPEPKPYSGKFDPKEIAKKAATSNTTNKTLDGEFNVPAIAKGSRIGAPIKGAAQGFAKPAAVRPQPSPDGAPHGPLKAKGFDLTGKQNQNIEANKIAKPTMDFDDEEATKKKIQRLPTPPPMEPSEDVSMTEGADQEQVDEDADSAPSDNDEDGLNAARAAAQKRSEQMMQSTMESNEAATDIQMTDEAQEQKNDEAEDPLDAYMQELSGKIPEGEKADGSLSVLESSGREAIFNEDDHEWDHAEEDNPLETRKSKKRKEVPAVDHSKVNYEPFRRSFFTAPQEIMDMTEDEINNLRFELDGIKVHGKDVPRPVTKWAQCGLGVQSLDVIQSLGFERPSSIQAQAIPAIMSGRDIIGVAKTGSGKTVAFLLPMFRHIKDQKSLEQLDGPIGLVLAPTRELATQIHRECKPWLKALNLRAVCAYGGAPIKDQIAELKRGAEIVVCTPGRFVDLLVANAGRVTNLRRVTYVVIDEADRMFDMGFEPQIRKIIGNVRPDRQLVMFSATFPKAMETLARTVLKNACEILVGGKSVVPPEIEQIVEVRKENTKFARLLKLLGDVHEDEDARTLVFVATQKVAEDLASDILKKGYPCNTIHGGKDQYDRDTTISDFKAGVFPVLVATSVAARGLDVKQLKMVVNFDCPNHLEDYIHRSGRTGRAGSTGTSVTFITPEQERYASMLQKALRQSGVAVPDDLQKLVESFNEKVQAGTAKHIGSASGFKGTKGLEQLEKDRELVRSRERKAFNAGDDEEAEQEEDAETAEIKKEEAETKPAGTSASGPVGLPAGIDLDKMGEVKKREDAGAPTSKDRMKGVSDAAAAINARLRSSGDIRGSAPIDNKGPDAGAFHSHIEINDFPQKARWAVTNRSNVSKILETTGVSITNKGNYYAPGVTVPDGAAKLAILIEGDTDLSVHNAVNQLKLLIRDACAAAADSDARAPTSGRYTVV